MNESTLKSFRDKRREVQFAKWSLHNIEKDMGYPPLAGPTEAKTKAGNRPQSSTVESAAEKKLRLQKYYNALLTAYDAEAVSIETALVHLTPDERSVIRAYYIQGLKWEDVCETLHISWSQVHRLKKSALRKLTGELISTG